MTKITIDLIKQLRTETGVSIMQCKKALIEAGGDLDKAKITLTKKSGEIAAKKGDRELKSGVIISNENKEKKIILELACETDFVANNKDFKELAQKLSLEILEGKKVQEQTNEATQKFGERVEVIRSEILDGQVGNYIHSNNSMGALVQFSGEIENNLAKNIAMHIAAQHPKYLKQEDISAEEIKKAEDTLREEVQDKPAEIQDKILTGKMQSFFKERVLLSQAFIKEPSKTISDLLPTGVEITKYIRFGLGEK